MEIETLAPEAPRVPTADDLPEGEYAIAEILGHSTMIGRYVEVECLSEYWYVAMTKHRQEFLARKQLRDQGYQVYLPKVFWHPNDEQKRPYDLRFPGYVLIGFDADVDDYGPINHTRGIDGDGLILGPNQKPQALRKGYVSHLQQIEDDDLERAMKRNAEPREDLRDGDEVQIHSPEHRLHGVIGRYMEAVHGTAWVLIGAAKWPFPEVDLKKIAKPLSKTKSKRKAKADLKKIEPERKAA